MRQKPTTQNDRLSAYAFWLYKHAPFLWLGFALLLVAAATGLGRLELNVNTQALFLEQSGLARQRFERKYQIGENIGIYIEKKSGSLLNAQQLNRIALLAQELKQLPFVRSVRSLSDLWRRQNTKEAQLADFENFVAKFPELSALHSKNWQSLWLPIELTPYSAYIEALKQQADDSSLFNALQRSAEAQSEKEWHLPQILEQNQIETSGQLLARLQQKGQTPERLFAQLLDELLQSYQTDGELLIIPVGITPNSYLLERELSGDLLRVLSIAAIICLLCIFVLLQSLRSAFAALLCITCNIALVFGGSGYLGLATDKTFVMIPILLGFASTISYCVHIEKSWFKSHKAGYKASAAALRENLRPLSFAAATTIVSLLSFIAVPIPMIRVAGLQSAAAVGFSYLLCLTLFCSLCKARTLRKGRSQRLAYSSYPDSEPSQGPQPTKKRKQDHRHQNALNKVRKFKQTLQNATYQPIITLALLCYRFRKLSLLCTGTLLAFSLFLLPRLEVNLSTESILGTRFRYVRQLLQVSRSEIGAGGFYNIDLHFPDEPLQKKWLERMHQFEDKLRAEKLVKSTNSVTRFILSVQRLYRSSNEFLPSAKGNRQALLTWEQIFGMERSRWYSGQSLRIMVQVHQASSRKNLGHMKTVERLASESFPNSVQVEALGGVFQLAEMNQSITSGLLRSLGLSLLCVAVLLFVLLRSVRLGLVALVPNLLPVIFGGAAVVLLGRQLEFISMTVGPMVIGLAVDDTIYFLGHIKSLLAVKSPQKAQARLQHLSKGDNNPKSSDRSLVFETQFDQWIRQTLFQVAPALITTTWILCALFASLLLSNAANIRYMGLYTVITMLTALFSDLFLAPILLRWAYTHKKRPKKNSTP